MKIEWILQEQVVQFSNICHRASGFRRFHKLKELEQSNLAYAKSKLQLCDKNYSRKFKQHTKRMQVEIYSSVSGPEPGIWNEAQSWLVTED